MKRETPLALYKGLGAVLSGIVPKMAIRFASFEAYKGLLADKETGKTSVGGIFIGASLIIALGGSCLISPFL
jgi:solute carrier family 25 citrate transporter 1